ncbi:hypothetical protein SARC_09143 [Sphaeroforma arctica JP610]|uniref:Uncharacterized protein n=1 Tax=Sphaeroforma arctica JP610 TaxID=667725 RepID=A0A0L0FNV9_9EUKA|nr:hypothetical protein SARC_09143 [Sphaeroforma arctica JP610]KNC78429.1 hypothetical protein SARC_09143 [Sphaeroforma arctica JP610]|eukprot:XP_014152331.1 hypothetical protein SARC_09143 [Sphaeroforma arctica JP610]
MVASQAGYHALIQGLKTWTLIKRNVASGRSARHVNSIIDCLYDAIDSYESLAELPRGRIGAASRQRNSVSMSCDSLSGDSFFSYDEAETLSLIGDQLGDTLDSQHGGYDTPLELRDLPALTQTEEDRAATGQTSTHTVTPTRLSPETLALATAQSLAAEDEGVVVHGGVQLVESTGVDEAGADMVNDKLADIRQPLVQSAKLRADEAIGANSAAAVVKGECLPSDRCMWKYLLLL